MLALSAALRTDPPPGLLEQVPGARTVLVRFDPARADSAEIEAHLRRLGRSVPGRGAGQADGFPARPASTLPPVAIDVSYDGPDLPEVARLTGLSPSEVIGRHTAATYVVAFTGFAPGFAYLAGGDPALAVPRRATPRVKVPAGSVALAGEFSGIYPREGPGGWLLLGRTEAVLWDLAARPPALLVPGRSVRFRAVTSAAPNATAES